MTTSLDTHHLLHLLIGRIEQLGTDERSVTGYTSAFGAFTLNKTWDVNCSPSETVHTISFDETPLWTKRGGAVAVWTFEGPWQEDIVSGLKNRVAALEAARADRHARAEARAAIDREVARAAHEAARQRLLDRYETRGVR